MRLKFSAFHFTTNYKEPVGLQLCIFCILTWHLWWLFFNRTHIKQHGQYVCLNNYFSFWAWDYRYWFYINDVNSCWKFLIRLIIFFVGVSCRIYCIVSSVSILLLVTSKSIHVIYAYSPQKINFPTFTCAPFIYVSWIVYTIIYYYIRATQESGRRENPLIRLQHAYSINNTYLKARLRSFKAVIILKALPVCAALSLRLYNWVYSRFIIKA